MATSRSHDTLLSQLHGVYLVCFYIVSFATVLYVDSNLPEPFLIKDELHHPNEFIAERAQNFLKQLTDLGPRIVGTKANEIDAVALLQKEIKQILSTATAKDDDIVTETWEVSGSYYLDFKPHGAINAYGNVQNVIVLLKSKSKKRSGKAILLNAHFDSVPTSPGASDDGIMCSIMLEVLRKLTHASPTEPPPVHDVIFLWNGAEETPLHASHGFISHLQSSNNSNGIDSIPRILINLESGGGGPGREILFQTGPKAPWLVREYAKVAKYPHGNVGGEEMFKANLVPSDTDFRVFRDFGKMQGYDFAFARGGYRYHTKYDTFDSIPLGSYQHVGSNVLALVKALRNAPDHLFRDIDVTSEAEPEPEVVYFDILYGYMVQYSVNVATVLNSVVVIMSLGAAVVFLFTLPKRQRFVAIYRSTILVLLSWLFAAAVVFVTAIILDKLGFSMRWYRFPVIVATLYVIPAAVSAAAAVLLMDKCFKNNTMLPVRKSDSLVHTTRIVMTVVLIIGTYYEIRTSYVICIPILINVIGFLSRFLPAVLKAALVVSAEFMWSVFIFYQFLLIFSLFIPITGRFGSDRNPELVVGGISLLLTFLLFSFHIPKIYTIKKPWKFLLSILGLSVLASLAVIVSFNAYSGDYASPTPQRFMIFHTNRIIRDKDSNIKMSDSGYFLLNLDRNSPDSVIPFVEELRTSGRQIGDDCDKALVCGLPLISPRMLAIARESTWVPTSNPAIFPPSIRTVLETKIITLPNTYKRFIFTASGPDRLNVYISPRDGAEVRNISLAVITATPAKSLDSGRPLYFINYVWGRKNRSLNFHVDVQVQEDGKSGNTGILDVAISGKYVHGVDRTQDFQKFLKQFPDWADVTSAQASFESFVV